jgi:hypothetical protein
MGSLARAILDCAPLGGKIKVSLAGRCEADRQLRKPPRRVNQTGGRGNPEVYPAASTPFLRAAAARAGGSRSLSLCFSA